MLTNEFFLIDDVERLRNKILNAEKGDKRQELWSVISRSIRSSKYDFAWYAPFVAAITNDEVDINNAKDVIATYLAKMEVMNYCMGLQFHFWCFAFPHAKICIYFQWLCELGVYTDVEKNEISAKLINYQFTNFYYGMRTKPEPECVDNQALSLALSNVIVGYIFSSGDNCSEVAKVMLRDGMKRLPEMIGGFPKCGYSGEGTPYMDVVIGPSIWICIEMLERIWKRDNLLYEEFPPSMVRPIDMISMIAKSWMPGGLLFPWDNYGYQMGIRSALSYVAKRTGDSYYYDKLEKHAIWSYDVGAGWAYDDLVWTLIHFPECNNKNKYEKNWFVDEVGGVIDKNNRYVLQMWDMTTPNYPTRAHVNPNAVIFNAFATPLSADGAKSYDCHRFDFDNTWKTVNYLKMNEDTRYNYGDGCLGAHSCVIIDGNEGMMALNDGAQIAYNNCAMAGDSIVGDATPIYRQNYEDITMVKRKTSLLDGKFFVIEDVLSADKEHSISSRFILRPELCDCKVGVKVKVNQGVSLNLVPLTATKEIKSEFVKGYPRKPDNGSVMIDFVSAKAKINHTLTLAFSTQYIGTKENITDFAGIHTTKDLTFDEANMLLNESDSRFNLNLPPYMEKDAPICRKWWFKKKMKIDRDVTHFILPIGFINGRLFICSEEISLREFAGSANLLYSYVEIPKKYIEKEIEIVFFTEVPIDHYENGGDGRTGVYGGFRLASNISEEQIEYAKYENGEIEIKTDSDTYRYFYQGLEK